MEMLTNLEHKCEITANSNDHIGVAQFCVMWPDRDEPAEPTTFRRYTTARVSINTPKKHETYIRTCHFGVKKSHVSVLVIMFLLPSCGDFFTLSALFRRLSSEFT